MPVSRQNTVCWGYGQIEQANAADTTRWVTGVADRHGKEVLQYLRARLGNPADAEDLAQEVYVRLLRVKDTRQIENIRGYVMRVAANLLYEHYQRPHNRSQQSDEALQRLSDDTDVHYEACLAEALETLEATLQRLSPKCRTVIVLHRRDRYTVREIAKQMGLSVAMVKKYLAQGLGICRQRVAGDLFEGCN